MICIFCFFLFLFLSFFHFSAASFLHSSQKKIKHFAIILMTLHRSLEYTFEYKNTLKKDKGCLERPMPGGCTLIIAIPEVPSYISLFCMGSSYIFRLDSDKIMKHFELSNKCPIRLYLPNITQLDDAWIEFEKTTNLSPVCATIHVIFKY
jgi:hypothetical protein